MEPKEHHPGRLLMEQIKQEGYTQREFASMLGIAHSHLNLILKGEKNINSNIAVALEALDLGTALYWMNLQVKHQITVLKSEKKIVKKTDQIKEWSSYSKMIPVKYFKKQGVLGDEISDNINSINRIYGISNSIELKDLIKKFKHVRYRKSNALKEERENVLAWEKMAEYKVSKIKTGKYDPDGVREMIQKLNRVFYENDSTIEKSSKILKKYGIRFTTLDRPPKTPVDGRSFMSDGTPAICLTLKYKRLDNFAYTLMHEIGHVYHHLTKNDKYTGFYADYKQDNLIKEETEADQFANNNLIDPEAWDKFYYAFDFTDESIRSFADEQKIHPAIIRGRVCYKHNEYYRRRSSINTENKTT